MVDRQKRNGRHKQHSRDREDQSVKPKERQTNRGHDCGNKQKGRN